MRREHNIELQRQGHRLWESPDILPREAWLRNLIEECAYRDPVGTPILLSAYQERALWEDAVRHSAEHQTDTSLLNIAETARIAARARALLHLWRIDPRGALPEMCAGLADAEAFLDWTAAIDRKLEEQGWMTLAEAPRFLEQRFRAGAVSPGNPIALAGFDEITPADRMLVDAVRVSGTNVSDYVIPARQAQSVIRYTFDSTTEEFGAAARWSRKQLEANPDARIGVIVHGLSSVIPVVERIFDDVLHPDFGFGERSRRSFQIAAGMSCSDVPIISAALLILRLNAGVPVSECGPLLRSPFSCLSPGDGARMDLELRRMGADSISFKTDLLRRRFAEAASFCAKLPSKQRPSQWSVAFSKILKAAGWPGPRTLSTSEHDALEHWEEILSDFARLDLVTARLTYREAVSRLRRISDATRFTTPDEDPPIQIMDMEEAAGARFDAIWAAGLHSGVWPQSPRPNPFLPVRLQREAEMPQCSVEREAIYARRMTARLLESADIVIFSSPRFAADEPLHISPLIESIPESVPDADPLDTAMRRVFLSGGNGDTAQLETIPDSRGPSLPPGSQVSGGTRMIADQAACPFRAFAVHRLGARELDEMPLGITATEHGNVAHDALHHFWRELRSQEELLKRPAEEINEAIHAAVRAALDLKLSHREKTASLERFRILEEARLVRFIARWLEKERTRKPFTVVQAEATEKVALASLELKIRADRVDQYADRTHAILDYKTGEVSRKDWYGDRPDSPQLPLYAVALDRERVVSEIAFARISAKRMEIVSESDMEQNLPEWRKIIDALAAEFAAGEARVDPKNGEKTCSHCALDPLCRIGERNNLPDRVLDFEGEGIRG